MGEESSAGLVVALSCGVCAFSQALVSCGKKKTLNAFIDHRKCNDIRKIPAMREQQHIHFDIIYSDGSSNRLISHYVTAPIVG